MMSHGIYIHSNHMRKDYPNSDQTMTDNKKNARIDYATHCKQLISVLTYNSAFKFRNNKIVEINYLKKNSSMFSGHLYIGNERKRH